MVSRLAIAVAPSLAAADDDELSKTGQSNNPFYALDTKNLFGFLEGADVGEQGDRSLEFETTGSFGRQQGVYNSIEQEIIFEPTLTDSLGVEFGAHVLGQDIHGVPGLPDFAGVNFMGASVELRYVVMHRTADLPIQVTVTAEPEYNSIADAGQQAADFSTAFRAIADVISMRSAPLWRGQSRLRAGRLAVSGSAMAGHGPAFRLRRALLSPDAGADVRRGGGL